MGAIIHSLPRHDTQSRQLLELIAISGDFPADSLTRLPGGTTYKESVVKGLKREHLIRTFYRDRLRTYRLTACAKKLLLAEQPERFSFYLVGNADTNLLKGEITRRLRLCQLSTVCLNMVLAGIRVFRDDKPEVFSPEGCPVSVLEESAFYNSREIKDMGLETTKIRGSRMAGALLTPSQCYVAYNSGSSMMKWESRSELRVKALLQMELCQRRLPSQYRIGDINAVLFGDSMDVAKQLLIDSKAAKKHYFILDGNYEHFYYLTNDHHGEALLRLLCDEDKTAELDRILMQGLSGREPGGHIEHDAVSPTGEPVLFGYFFDLPRIVRFHTGLELQGKNGTIICFDFQSEALRSYCIPQIRLQTIDFAKFERGFFP